MMELDVEELNWTSTHHNEDSAASASASQPAAKRSRVKSGCGKCPIESQLSPLHGFAPLGLFLTLANSTVSAQTGTGNPASMFDPLLQVAMSLDQPASCG